MKERIDSFSLLLGGVRGFDVGDEKPGDEKQGLDEEWRTKVIAIARTRLSKIGGQLRARER